MNANCDQTRDLPLVSDLICPRLNKGLLIFAATLVGLLLVFRANFDLYEFSKFASTASESDFAAKVGDYIDLDNFSRYMAITAWLTDLDGILGPGQNYYLYLHPKTQKFLFIPWDQDQPFGQFPRGTQEQRENLSIHKPWTGENRFLERVYKCESFKKIYLARLADFNKTIFEAERIHRQVNELAGVLRAPIQEESPERLSEFDKAVAGQNLTIVMGPGFQGGDSGDTHQAVCQSSSQISRRST